MHYGGRTLLLRGRGVTDRTERLWVSECARPSVAGEMKNRADIP